MQDPRFGQLATERGLKRVLGMLCPSCLRESPTPAHFCLACGARLVEGKESLRRDELGRVRWAIAQTYDWPADLVADAARHALRDHYRAREAVLVEQVSGPRRPVARAVEEVTAPPAPRPAPPSPAALLPSDGLAEAPSAEPTLPPPGPMHGPPRPTLWERHLRPFLGESVGWFIGAFLILSGTLYFVADAWAAMSSAVRALTVFGLAAGWTLVFAAWARFLARRPGTETAARALWRIAGAVSPLASVALGAASALPAFTVPLLLAWSVVTGAVGRRVGRASDEKGAPWLGASLASATLLLGAAPWFASLGAAAAWLALVPTALALASWRKGPRATPAENGFSFVSMAWPVLLVAVRLHVALHTDAVLGAHAVTLALLGLGALSLREKPGRAADPLAVAVVAAQGALLVPAFFAPAPAFVVAALVAAASCLHLARQRVSVASARWLAPAYVFAYVAYQHVDQLVPDAVVRAFTALKVALGYASAPLPASYASVYAALFVVGVGAFAAWRDARSRGAERAEASVLLWTTAVASMGFSALALASVGDDARPAMLACPLLAALGLGLGAWRNRRESTWAGSAAALAAGLAFAVGLQSALPVALLALALAARSVPATRAHRLPTSLAAGLLAGLAAVLAFAAPTPDSWTLLSLVLASAAALAVARNLDTPGLLEAAGFGPLLVVLHLGSPALLAASAVAGALALPAAGVDARRKSAAPALVAGAFLAPGWMLATRAPWLGAAWLAAAVTSWLVARRVATGAAKTALEVAALVLAPLALVPGPDALRAWPFLTPALSVAGAAALALGASVRAVLRGRGWQTAVLASAALAVALWATLLGPTSGLAAGVGLVALLSTGALLPGVTVPAAALALAAAYVRSPEALAVLAAVASAVALLEEWDWTWRLLLNRARVAWAGVVVAALAALGAVAFGAESPVALAAAVLLPAAWVRATRQPGWAVASVALVTVAGLVAPGPALLLAPLLAVTWSRALPAWSPAKSLFSLARRADLLVLVAATACAGATAALLEGPWRLPALAAWAVAFVFLRDEYAVARLVAASALVACWPDLHAVAPVVLLALAFLASHRPQAARALLGTENDGYLSNASALLAVATSVLGLVHGAVGGQALLAVSLASAALLVGVPALLVAALLASSVDVVASVLAERVVWLPWGPQLAVALAALVVVLRRTTLRGLATDAWRALGGDHEAPFDATWWAALVLGAALVWTGSPFALATAALLFVTTSRYEAALALTVGAAFVLRRASFDTAATAFAVGGLVLAWAGAQQLKRWPVARVWLHAGWLLAVSALAFAHAPRHPAFALAWVLGAGTAWAVARATRRPWLGWLATAAALHAGLAWVGLALATGAPWALILPWFALGSAVLAAAASSRTRLSGLFAAGALSELAVALALVSGPATREGVAAVLAAAVLAVVELRRAIFDDDVRGAVTGPLAVAVGVLAARWLGFGAAPGGVDAWLAVVLGALLAGGARFLEREERVRAAAALRVGALAWPLAGLVVAPWGDWHASAPLLAALAAHFTWTARCGARRAGPVLAAVAFNGAVAVAFLGAGASSVELLAIPAGLSLLALVRVFEGDLSDAARARLRGVAMAIIYGATALRPLAFPSTWALVLCAATCVAGVAAGVVFRIRSYVVLGTVFLVATVVTTLVRYGIQEPRLGALFLSGLGLAVVAVMVAVTTRRAQVQAQVSAMQRMLAQWE